MLRHFLDDLRKRILHQGCYTGMEVTSLEPEWRHTLGIPVSDQEGHVLFKRDNGDLTILNGERPVWTGTLAIPDSEERNHESLVKMFTDAGFHEHDFRRGFARQFFGRIPLKPCTTKCACSDAMRVEFSANIDRNTCIWDRVRSYENFWSTFYMKPDAWLVLKEHRTLVVVEVDVTHHHDRRRYIDVWWWLDCESWNLCVIHVDRHANVCSPHDLAHYWYENAHTQPHGDVGSN